MQVWDGVSDAGITFDWGAPSPARRAAAPQTVAYMTENLNLTSALLARLEELGGLDVFDKTRVDGVALGQDTPDLDMTGWPVVRLSSGATLAARLLVGADGGNSPVRAFSGIASRGWDYGRHGVVATMRLAGGARDVTTAYQRFLPTGPVALLPLPGEHATLVWSTLPSHAAHLKTLPPADFTALVNAAFRLSPVDLAYMHTQPRGQADEVAWRLQHTPVDAARVPRPLAGVQEGSVASFPLKMRHADEYVGERVALVGYARLLFTPEARHRLTRASDAAHTIHPLAGQGLNQGQGDVQALAQTILYAVRHGQDIGT